MEKKTSGGSGMKKHFDWKIFFFGLSLWVAFIFLWLLMGRYLPNYHRIGAYSGPSILIVGVIIFMATCLRMRMGFAKSLRWLVLSMLGVYLLRFGLLKLTGPIFGVSVYPSFTFISILVLLYLISYLFG
jgi:hypothetical protein